MSRNFSSTERRRVTFGNDVDIQSTRHMLPPPPIPLNQELPPQNARHEPYQTDSSYLTVQRLSANGMKAPLTRQYVNDPTRDPTNHWWQAISSHPGQQYGRARLEEVIRQGEIMRPEFNTFREPWQRSASLTRLRPMAKANGIITERRRGNIEDNMIYALSPEANFQFPDSTRNPADLKHIWKSILRQPHERPKTVFDKQLIERYPDVYGPNGASSPIVNPSCPPPPLSTSLKPFPYHSIDPPTKIRPWTARK